MASPLTSDAAIEVRVEGFAPTQAASGAILLEVCEAAGIPMESACGGFACCNSCRVQVIEGWENLGDLREEERPFLDANDQRLGCQATVHGPVALRLAPGE